MTTKLIGVKELRQNLATVSLAVERGKARYVVLRKNKPIFELRSINKKDLARDQFILDIRKGLEDIRAGRVYSARQARKILGI